MRVLLVHPSPLMYSELYLRPGARAERVAAAIEAAGHEVRLLPQIFKPTTGGGTFVHRAVGFSVTTWPTSGWWTGEIRPGRASCGRRPQRVFIASSSSTADGAIDHRRGEGG
jgi:hypothetical protein